MQKRNYIHTIHVLSQPIEKIWQIISSSVNIEKWHPLVYSCSVEAQMRICKTEQGDLKEEILVNDQLTKTYKYLIHPQNIYPVKDYILCTIRIAEGKQGTLFMWDIEFPEVSVELYREMEDGFNTLADASCNMLNVID